MRDHLLVACPYQMKLVREALSRVGIPVQFFFMA
jgi:hypothetical protein